MTSLDIFDHASSWLILETEQVSIWMEDGGSKPPRCPPVRPSPYIHTCHRPLPYCTRIGPCDQQNIAGVLVCYCRDQIIKKDCSFCSVLSLSLSLIHELWGKQAAMLCTAVGRGPCGRKARPQAGCHMSKAGGRPSGPVVPSGDLPLGQHLGCSLLRDPESGLAH